MSVTTDTDRRRNKGYDDTHAEMIQTAVALISDKGVDAVSIASVARAMKINRTTVYYHFESRDALISAVKDWSSGQLAKAFSPVEPQQERIEFITRFVLENPDLISLWIEDFISAGDIRTRYPHWDAMVAGIRDAAAQRPEGESIDAEVFCVMLLTSAIIGPRVFKGSVRPDERNEDIVRRFRAERQRLLKWAALLKQ